MMPVMEDDGIGRDGGLPGGKETRKVNADFEYDDLSRW
jgi:hypothetical protein